MDQNPYTQSAPSPKPKKAKSGGKLAAVVVTVVAVVLVVIILAATCFRTVPTGYTGILTTFGRVEDSNLDAGFHVIMPWQKIVLMDNRVQKETVDSQAFSSDIQQVDVRLTVTYMINKSSAAGLYAQVGTHYYDNIIYPQLMENTKTVFANYTAEGLIEQRDQLAVKVTEMMQNDVSPYGIDVANVAIENIDFSDRFTDAIEAKQVATQELQRAQTQQEQATLEAEAAANRQKIAAEAEAEANQKIAQSLTEELISYTEAQSWNGELPATYVGSADSLPVLNVETEKSAE